MQEGNESSHPLRFKMPGKLFCLEQKGISFCAILYPVSKSRYCSIPIQGGNIQVLKSHIVINNMVSK